MDLFQKTLILVAFVIPLLMACGNDAAPEEVTPNNATFDNATFDKSTWE